MENRASYPQSDGLGLWASPCATKPRIRGSGRLPVQARDLGRSGLALLKSLCNPGAQPSWLWGRRASCPPTKEQSNRQDACLPHRLEAYAPPVPKLFNKVTSLPFPSPFPASSPRNFACINISISPSITTWVLLGRSPICHSERSAAQARNLLLLSL